MKKQNLLYRDPKDNAEATEETSTEAASENTNTGSAEASAGEGEE
jgi:hypothetical protein